MKQWPKKPLGEIAKVTAGNPAPQRAKDFSDDGIPFVRMQDVGRFGQTTRLVETKDRLSESASKRLERFPVGSILVPKSGASIRLNHRAILGTEAHVVSHLAVIIPKPPLNTRFAYYWLCGMDLSGIAHQADLPSMKTSDLAKIPIPLPPLVEQERIVKLLDEADELRKLRAQADHRTADLIPALFHEMFGNPVANTKGWKRVMFADLLDEIESGWSPTCHDRRAELGEWGVLKLGAVTTCEYIDVENKALPEHFAVRPELEVKVGDVLFTRKNTYELVAACAVVFETRPKLMLSDLIFRFRIKSNIELNPVFLWGLLTETGKRKYTQTLAGGSAGSMPNISKGRLLGLPIELPPLGLQNEFAHRVAEIRALESAQATSRTRLETLFQSMLHRAFNGDL